jgi:cytochrome P450 family 6
MGDLTGIGKRHFNDCLRDVYQNFKKQDVLCGFFNTFEPKIIPLDLNLIKDILVKDFNNFVDRGVYYNEEADPLSANLFAIEGEKWRFLRNKLSPTFTSGKMKMMFHTIADKGTELINAIERESVNGPMEAKNLSVRFTSDVIANCAFGLECGGLKNGNSDPMKIAEIIFSFRGLKMIYFFFIESFKGTARKLGLRLFPKDIEQFFMKIIQDTINLRKNEKLERKDFMNMLIQLMEKGNIDDEVGGSDTRKITFKELAAQAFIFFFAGFETTSTTMSFMLYELAYNQDIQDKVRKEIQDVVKKHNGEITYDAIQEMTYLRQTFDETLRKYPPAGFLFRIAVDDYKVRNSNHIIEKGSSVIVPAYSIHHDPEIYPNPDRFDPDRFTQEEIEKRHNYAYLPFGEGNRNCIGVRFAILETKFAFAKILSEYKITLNSKTDQPLKLNPDTTVLEALSGIWINFEKL